jgi:hypothetical protein
MHQSDVERALARLQSQLDVYRALERYVSHCGEAYPGETATIQKNIRCLSILLSQEQQRDRGS